MNRSDIINHLLKEKLCYKSSYLEIGLNKPEDNYFKIECAHKECVDPFIGPCVDFSGDMDWVINSVLTYRQTSDEFFASCNKKYDLIFIDGLHVAEQVVKDIINSYNHLNDGGYIVVHDCIPLSEATQSENRVPGEWNGTTWKAIPNLYKVGIEYFVVNTDFGCGIIKHTGPKNFNGYTPTILSYKEVFSNNSIRDAIMHVISENEFLNM